MADQWTKHLADQGYTGIAFPSPEFRLLTLVYERKGARGHENAFEELAPGVAGALGAPEANTGIPSISGERTRSVDLGVGLKILSGLLSALGAGTLSVEAGFKTARKLTFAYEGITSETLNAVALQKALATKPAPQDGLLADWLEDHLYVITSLLRARKFTVSAQTDSGASAKIDVPVISGAIGANVSVKTGATDGSKVVFEGENGVPFAARLFRVLTDGDRLTLRNVREGQIEIKGVAANVPGEEPEPRPTVLNWTPEDAEVAPLGG